MMQTVWSKLTAACCRRATNISLGCAMLTTFTCMQSGIAHAATPERADVSTAFDLSASMIADIREAFANGVPPPAAKDFNKIRLLGSYYEIATYMFWPEMGCRNTTMGFAQTADVNTLDVALDCDRVLIGHTHVNAIAHSSDPHEPARFVLEAHAMGQEIKQNMVVMLVADDYRYAVIGERTREMLWVLSRSPMLDDADFEVILDTLSDTLGYHDARQKLSCVSQKGVPHEHCQDHLEP